MNPFYYVYMWWLLAFFHISEEAVCIMSKGKVSRGDFHDYTDATPPSPTHFYSMRCRRCEKEFYI